MERTKYNRSGGGAGRARGGGISGSGGGRGGCGGGRSGSGETGGNNYQKYHQGRYQTTGGGGNNYQKHNQGQYQSGGYGRRGGRDGGWSGAQMGTNPPPSQPWGDRPFQGGQGGSQMGTYPPRAQSWGYRPVQRGQGGTPESSMGQGVGATGGRGAWIGGPPFVAGRGSWASTVGGGDGAVQAQRRILYMFLFLSLFLFTMLPLLPIKDEWKCSLLLQLHHQLLSHHHRLHLRFHWTISSTSFTGSSRT